MSKGTKQIRFGRVEKLIKEWEIMIEQKQAHLQLLHQHADFSRTGSGPFLCGSVTGEIAQLMLCIGQLKALGDDREKQPEVPRFKMDSKGNLTIIDGDK